VRPRLCRMGCGLVVFQKGRCTSLKGGDCRCRRPVNNFGYSLIVRLRLLYQPVYMI
jgi:hypothetical protein